jgi:hypothetical protein
VRLTAKKPVVALLGGLYFGITRAALLFGEDGVSMIVASTKVPELRVAVSPEEAERRCRRALMVTWVGRESAVFKRPPKRAGS